MRKEIENRACPGFKALGFEGMQFKWDRDRQKWYGPLTLKNLETLDRWQEVELSPEARQALDEFREVERRPPGGFGEARSGSAAGVGNISLALTVSISPMTFEIKVWFSLTWFRFHAAAPWILNIDRRSWLHVDYLCPTSFKEHCLGVVELTIVDPNIVVLVASYSEAELSIQRISTSPLRAYVIAI
jgi:hypothetical protein